MPLFDKVEESPFMDCEAVVVAFEAALGVTESEPREWSMLVLDADVCIDVSELEDGEVELPLPVAPMLPGSLVDKV